MEIIKKIKNFIQTPITLYIMWIILHYISSYLYIELCTPPTLSGFLLSPIIAPSPHCTAIRWILYTGGNIITNMWIMIGGWIIHKIIIQ